MWLNSSATPHIHQPIGIVSRNQGGGGGGSGGVWMAPAWPSSGERGLGRAILREWMHPSLSPLRVNVHPTRNQEPEDSSSWSRTHRRRFRGISDMEGPTTGEPSRIWQGPGCRPRAEKWGLENSINGGRQRNAARVADLRSGGCRVAGVDNV